MRKKMLRWGACKGEKVDGTFCKKVKVKRNSQGKDPRTFDENSQGGDFSTPKTNSWGEDPRTCKEPVEKWRVHRSTEEGVGRKSAKLSYS